ncbi:MAG: GTP cyclohydrolase I FolE [Actinomycetota bacterium]|nr:GTP cyclohydrolase I FolE [Actinomycetota bacterium]
MTTTPIAPASELDGTHDRLEAAVVELLEAMGEDPEREGLRETPRRVAKMWRECLDGRDEDPADHLNTTFEIDHSEVVIVRDIAFTSFCEHHLLPFIGTADVAYLPGESGRFTGLSKLARLVDGYARRLQVQERMTSQIADAVSRALDAEGVLVMVRAEHTCMSIRGVRKPGSTTVTSSARGIYRTDPREREYVSRLMSAGH